MPDASPPSSGANSLQLLALLFCIRLLPCLVPSLPSHAIASLLSELTEVNLVIVKCCAVEEVATRPPMLLGKGPCPAPPYWGEDIPEVQGIDRATGKMVLLNVWCRRWLSGPLDLLNPVPVPLPCTGEKTY